MSDVILVLDGEGDAGVYRDGIKRLVDLADCTKLTLKAAGVPFKSVKAKLIDGHFPKKLADLPKKTRAKKAKQEGA